MSLAQMLSCYLNLNLLIAMGFLSLRLLSSASVCIGRRVDSRAELRLHYFVLASVIVFSLAQPLMPKNDLFAPAAKVWSASSIKNFGRDYSAADRGGYLVLPTPNGRSILPADRVAKVWLILGALLFTFGSLFILRDLKLLFVIKRNSFLWRNIGQVRILLSDRITVPFSYWLPGQVNVVVPTTLAAKPIDFRISIAHEIQHHRHGDTQWVFAIWGLRLFCIINPAIHFWNNWIMEVQEFACDETLVDRKNVDSRAYASCLVEVAQSAIGQKFVPVCATGLTFLTERNLLKRRIEKMLTKKTTQKCGRKTAAGVGVALAIVMGASAYASKGLVQDRRISLAQARSLAAHAVTNSGFPVAVNADVVKQLNRFVGTPEGREMIRAALARMQTYKATIAEVLKKYDAPAEILAVPLIESGYQNLPEGQYSSMHAAGLWQFIPSTARNFELIVNEQKDERLDVPRASDAAVRYLQSNHLRFDDWQLAALSYNMGEKAVQHAIDVTGSRDAWALIHNGYEGDAFYLAKLNAAILIMDNPDIVK